MPPRRRRKRVALLVNFLDSAYQLSFRNAIERAAREHDVDLLVAIGRELEHTSPSERVLNVVYDWLRPESIDGAIVLSAALANFVGSEGLARLCHALGVPVVSIGLELDGLPSIVFDNQAAMRVAVEHLIVWHNCRRIAYVGGPSHNQEARARFDGYRDTIEAHDIPFDSALVATGHFTAPTGRDAMRSLLERGVSFDAVVAANDYMALGAMDVLCKAGLEIPEKVRVVGFDDSPVARFATRSLSSVAQPIDEMANLALRSLLSRMAGRDPEFEQLDVHLVQRESCGCRYMLAQSERAAPIERESAGEYILRHREALAERLLAASGASREFWRGFIDRMLSSLVKELNGAPGAFLHCMEAIAEQAAQREGSLEDIGRSVVQLRRECRNAGLHGAEHVALEEACMRALTVLAGSSTRREGRRALDLMDHAYGLRHVSQQLSVALEPRTLAQEIHAALPPMGVQDALVALCSAERPGELSVFCAIKDGKKLVPEVQSYPANWIYPEGFPGEELQSCQMVLPLTFEREVIGLVAFDGTTDPFVCELLRAQLSASLKLGSLHHRVVQETAHRERLAHQQLLGEMGIAKRIQQALAPKDPHVEGLEVAASILSADQVGGDYYDIVKTSDGCWIGIGDVTGHGLLAGLIMLMLQTAVSSLVTAKPAASPAEIVCLLNDVLRPNVRERLGIDDHATFLLLRYRGDGSLQFAGAHEDILIHRKASGACEVFDAKGVWLGILGDIRASTPNHELTLHPGDLMVLYTDGLIESRNARGVRFGIERVRALVEELCELPVREIHDRLLDEARSWSPMVQDDVTLVVVRRR